MNQEERALLKMLLSRTYGAKREQPCTHWAPEEVRNIRELLPQCLTLVRPEATLGIEKVIHNGPCTIVFFNDGVKTMVRCAEGDTYDEELGVFLCLAKRLFGKGYAAQIQPYIKRWNESSQAEANVEVPVADGSSEVTKGHDSRAFKLPRQLKHSRLLNPDGFHYNTVTIEKGATALVGARGKTILLHELLEQLGQNEDLCICGSFQEVREALDPKYEKPGEKYIPELWLLMDDVQYASLNLNARIHGALDELVDSGRIGTYFFVFATNKAADAQQNNFKLFDVTEGRYIS